MELREVIAVLETVLPPTTIEEGDPSGLLIGDMSWQVHHIRYALEATSQVINKAIKDQVDLLIVHHPMIYTPIKTITNETPLGHKTLQLISHKIALFAAHSTLDWHDEGLNVAFGSRLGILGTDRMVTDTTGFYRKGVLEESTTISQYVKNLQSVFNNEVRYIGNGRHVIKSVGYCSGSGLSLVSDIMYQEVDVLVTGDIKYHDARDIEEAGYNVIVVPHFNSEINAGLVLQDMFRDKLPIHTSVDDQLSDPFKS